MPHWHHHHHDGEAHFGARYRGFRGGEFGPFGAGFWGGPWGGHHGGGPFRGGRMFGQGDLRYIVLQLLAEKPRHGYDVIKELEERFGGAYSPSPGTVYPTLAMLEDLGYAVARTEDGKKIYEITDAGRRYLADHRNAVDELFDRIAEFGATFLGGPMMDVHRAFRDLGRAVYTRAWHSSDAEELKRLREILERTVREVEQRQAAESDSERH
jgi:DNA-binding PadR family transcriptional regulator